MPKAKRNIGQEILRGHPSTQARRIKKEPLIAGDLSTLKKL